ncbi:Fic family protein [Calidithermus roseus]|uniref:Adenosine monophosphate-protein transferase SoFic n=1 Tax=Calidithermus roseus TaxID=1644118 RepID=A0A399EVK9_9DEIN|nr:Fic family protein [Calidithermus roseus]RIH87466.1 Adenosine monophosphate-protein transferase SoFic [Calidithermus roseus]
MRPEDFSPQAPGKLFPIGGGAYAFVPDPLPSTIPWSQGFVRLLDEARGSLGELAGLLRTLPNPYLFIRPFVRKEAVLSSRIEGTQASLVDVYALEAQVPLLPLGEIREDAREVLNYIQALERGRELLRELPLSLRLLREMHAVLLQGVRGHSRAPGEFRRVQNWIGSPGSSLQEARYVPPPPGPMLEALDALERFWHSEHGLPPLVEIALVHYQFEAIHPFLDGNGRIGRLLITLMLLERGLLPEPALYLSAYFERHRSTYYDLLLRVSQEGAWEEWFAFFLQAVQTEAKDAASRAQSLLALRQGWRERYQREGGSAYLLALVDLLFEQPVLTVPWVMKRLQITHAWANRLVKRLTQDKILEPIGERKRNRPFAARAVLEALEV